MGFPLYLLISGDVFYLGLSLVAGGVVAARWHGPLGRGLAWSGVVLVVASAVPIHPAGYFILNLMAAAWQVSQSRRPRFRRGATIALFITLAVLLVAALAVRRGSRLPLPRDKMVYVLGDSISAGLGASGEGTWPQLLSARLTLNVMNLARAGATLSDGASQARAIPPGSATVLVELGGNDLLAGTTPARFEADLRALLAGLTGRDRRVFMFELPLLPFQNAFGRVQRDVCQQHGVMLLPRSILAGAVALPGHASDGLHLSARGHAWLAGRVSEM